MRTFWSERPRRGSGAQADRRVSPLLLFLPLQLLLDAGLLSTYLTDVNTWAVANPTEVISILIVNSDGVNAATFGAAFVVRPFFSLSSRPICSLLPSHFFLL